MDLVQHSARGLANDTAFGPQYLDQFDFTLNFEAAIFNIIPSVILILVCPLYFRVYHGGPVVSKQGPFLWAKVTIATSLILLEVIRCIFWNALAASYRTDVSIAATSLTCAAAFCVLTIVVLEHRHSLHPSSFLSLFVTISILLDVAQIRSMLLRQSELHLVGAITASITGVKVVILLSLEFPKRLAPNVSPDEPITQDSAGGFWTRTLVLWINQLFFFGFRNALAMKDLANLGPDFSAKGLMKKFDPIWAKANKETRYALLKVTLSVLLWPFIFAAVPRLLFTGFNFTGPFLIQRILLNLNVHVENDPYYTKGSLIASVALVYVGVALTRVSHIYLTNRLATLIRGMLVGQIIKKNLALESTEAKKAAALTLMSADVDGIIATAMKFHEIWASFFDVGISLFLLSTLIGHAWFLPAIPIAIAVAISWKLGKVMGPATMTWNKSIETRVSNMAGVLSQIRGLKMTGLESTMTLFMQKLRLKEIASAEAIRRIRVILVGSFPLHSWGAPSFALVGGLFWTTFTDGLHASSIFTTLALLTLLDMPMVAILNFWPGIESMLACFDRIQQFLLLPERADARTVGNSAGPSESSTSGEKPTSFVPDTVKPPIESPSPCITLSDVSVASLNTGEPVLKHINISIDEGSLASVIGPVGCGKSLFLKTLLGETTISEGAIHIAKGPIAYCDQRAWLPDSTIREAMLGEIEYDEEWYNKVIRACALDHDFAQLTEGDQTILGTNGSVVSGGQKQRIAAGRAVYSRAPIVVLDDVVSSLDRETAELVFARLLGPDGLLKSQGRTTILATHSVQFLYQSDQIIVIDDNGHVTEDTAKMASTVPNLQTDDEAMAAVKQQSYSNTPPPPPPIVTRSALDLQFEKSSASGDFSLYTYFLQSVPKSVLVAFICCIAIVSMMEVLPLIYVRIWVGIDPTNKNYFWGFLALGFTCAAFNGGTAWLYMLVAMPKIGERLHQIFLESVMRAKIPFLTSTSNGALLNRFSQDMTLLNQELPMSFYSFTYMIFIAITHTVVIATGARYAGLLIPFTLALLFVLQYFYLRTSRQLRILDLEAKTPLYTKLSETCNGLEHIRAFGWQKKVLEDSLELLDYSQKSYYYMFCVQRWLVLVLEIYSAMLATILVTMALVWKDTTSQAGLGLALVSCIDHSTMMRFLLQNWVKIETSLGAIARLRDFVQDTPQESDSPDAVTQPQDFPGQARIEFRNVSARYNMTGPPQMALEDVTLTAEPGQETAICGRTGCGKSTAVLALLNGIEYTGSITIDGVEISKIPREQLRTMITTIPQDPIQIPGSVRDNLLPKDMFKAAGGRTVNDAAINHVLENVGILGHIGNHGGIDTPLEDMAFSHGQKQLLSIARAVLHKQESGSRILVMDEATSSMDHATEEIIQCVIKSSFSDCTRIVVAHWPTGLVGSDSKYTLDDGRVISGPEN